VPLQYRFQFSWKTSENHQGKGSRTRGYRSKRDRLLRYLFSLRARTTGRTTVWPGVRSVIQGARLSWSVKNVARIAAISQESSEVCLAGAVAAHPPVGTRREEPSSNPKTSAAMLLQPSLCLLSSRGLLRSLLRLSCYSSYPQYCH
jgi:hypothetical protein